MIDKQLKKCDNFIYSEGHLHTVKLLVVNLLQPLEIEYAVELVDHF